MQFLISCVDPDLDGGDHSGEEGPDRSDQAAVCHGELTGGML
jgi:hypothetical protein